MSSDTDHCGSADECLFGQTYCCVAFEHGPKGLLFSSACINKNVVEPCQPSFFHSLTNGDGLAPYLAASSAGRIVLCHL